MDKAMGQEISESEDSLQPQGAARNIGTFNPAKQEINSVAKLRELGQMVLLPSQDSDETTALPVTRIVSY